MNTPVLQTWVTSLSFMKQSVLLASIRAADGLPKDHVSKKLLRWYRRCILYSAFESKETGTPTVLRTPWAPGGGSFTGPSAPSFYYREMTEDLERRCWLNFDDVVDAYLASVDEVPHHFHLHFMHAAEIVGYHHEDLTIRTWWNRFYLRCVNDMHLVPESLEALNARLGDSEENWRKAETILPAPPLTAAVVGTVKGVPVRTVLPPDAGLSADAVATIVSEMGHIPEDACDVHRCGTPHDGVSRLEYDVTCTPAHPWNKQGLGRCYQQLCRTHCSQMGRGIVGHIRAPRPIRVDRPADMPAAYSGDRKPLPSEHPDHVCGMHCDGQDGMNSTCAQTRSRLFPPKCRKCGGSGEDRSAVRLTDGAHGFYPPCTSCTGRKG